MPMQVPTPPALSAPATIAAQRQGSTATSGPAPSSVTSQGLLEERLEFDVPDKDSRAPAVFRLEAKAFAPQLNTSVRIRCVRLCRSPFEWTAKVDDEPQGAMVYGEADGSTLLLTQWLGGTYAWVRLYEIRSNSVKILVEAKTRNGVRLSPTASGYPTIVVTPQTPGTQAVGRRVPLDRYSWDQRRGAYLIQHRDE